jgi:glycosyltransferase involved in cell wall biosynthesis
MTVEDQEPKSAWNRARRIWRWAAPHALRARGGYLVQDLTARWRGGRQAVAAPASPASVEIAGLHSAVIGIGEGARLATAALARAGYGVSAWDLAEAFGRSSSLSVQASKTQNSNAEVVIFHLNAPELIHLVAAQGGGAFRGRRVIGYWAWELERAPPRWALACSFLDEIWCPSQFSAEAIIRLAPHGMPVRVVAHPIHELPVGTADRGRFGLPRESVVVLTSFDVGSTVARKNPQAALEAFRRAAEGLNVDCMLVCKVVGAERSPAAQAELQALAGDQVRLMTEPLSDQSMADLVASSDIILSLHRSEGFGLLLARGMLAGKLVIATGWSGNLEFMDEASSILVPYRLEAVNDPAGLYRGGRWAEPDIAYAAEALRAAMRNEDMRAAVGAAAQAALCNRFNEHSYGALLRQRLGAPAPPAS